MSRFAVGNLFLLLSMASTAGAHVLLKLLLDDGPTLRFSGEALMAALSHRNLPRWLLVIGMLGAGFGCWLLCLNRLDLSYAYPIACSSVLFVAFLSTIFLGETVTPRMWVGTALVVVGIVLLMPTEV